MKQPPSAGDVLTIIQGERRYAAVVTEMQSDGAMACKIFSNDWRVTNMTTNELIKEHREGLFKIDKAFLEGNDAGRVLAFMANFLVVHATTNYDNGSIIYVAYSALFEPTNEGDLIPEYRFEFTANEEGLTWETKRIS